MLEAYDYFGILPNKDSKTHSLWCQVNYYDPDGAMHCSVLNGRWDFHITYHGDFVMPGGDSSTMKNWAYGYMGPRPKFSDWDYDDAIAFMDDQISKPYVVRWSLLKWFKVKVRIDRFTKACTKAYQAYRKVYNPKLQFETSVFDDDIPF